MSKGDFSLGWRFFGTRKQRSNLYFNTRARLQQRALDAFLGVDGLTAKRK